MAESLGMAAAVVVCNGLPSTVAFDVFRLAVPVEVVFVIGDVFPSTYMAFQAGSKMRLCDSNGQRTPEIWIFGKFKIFYFKTAGGRIDVVNKLTETQKVIVTALR
jgi:hypothetical protein